MGDIIQNQQNALAGQKKAPATIQGYIKAMAPAIKAALPSVMTPERFTRITLSAVSRNPKLGKCDPATFLGAMMNAAQLGVEPNTPLGQAFLIPFWSGKRKCYECEFQLGYKGMIDLAYRSGDVSIIQAHAVHENDEFEFSYGLEPILKHIPAMKDRGNVYAYYGTFETKNGGYGFQVMSIDDIRNHAKTFSKTYENGPWQTNFDEMAKKTVLKKALKYAPMSSEFIRAMAQDETIKNDIAADMSEIPDMTEYIDAETVDGATGEARDNG